MGKIYDQIKDRLTDIIDSYVDYCENHNDSGDGYRFLWNESGGLMCNRELFKAIIDAVKDNYGVELPNNQDVLEAVESYIGDAGVMVTGSIWGVRGNGYVTLDAYSLQEIEIHVEPSMFDDIDCEPETLERALDYLASSNEFCMNKNGDGYLAYETTDAAWFFALEIGDDEIANDLLEKLAELELIPEVESDDIASEALRVTGYDVYSHYQYAADIVINNNFIMQRGTDGSYSIPPPIAYYDKKTAQTAAHAAYGRIADDIAKHLNLEITLAKAAALNARRVYNG